MTRAMQMKKGARGWETMAPKLRITRATKAGVERDAGRSPPEAAKRGRMGTEALQAELVRNGPLSMMTRMAMYHRNPTLWGEK